MAELYKKVTLSKGFHYLNTQEIGSREQVSGRNNEHAAERSTNQEPRAQSNKQEFLSINLEEIKNESYQIGFNQGYIEGLDHSNLTLKKQINLVQTLLENIPTAISQNRQQLSSEIADIVLIIIQQFFINQQTNIEAIAKQINQTLTQLNNKHNIELALHPKDLALLQQGLLHLELSQCKGLRIVADEHLRLGGCRIKSEHGLFDAGIERQIDNLKQALLDIKQRSSVVVSPAMSDLSCEHDDSPAESIPKVHETTTEDQQGTPHV
jgi:flagellar assembly protein FliH